MNEIWKDIIGFEGKYQISNKGNVKSLTYHRGRYERLLKPRKNTRYMYVHLSLKNKITQKYIHRLVAEYFVDNPYKKPYVNHKDGNKHNNNADNLEWVTPLENNLHAYHVLKKHPMKGYVFDKNKNSKKVEQHYISKEGYDYILAVYANAKIAARINKLQYRSILSCCENNREYKEVGGYIWKFKNKEG